MSIIHNSLLHLSTGVNELLIFQVASREAQVSRSFLCCSPPPRVLINVLPHFPDLPHPKILLNLRLFYLD